MNLNEKIIVVDDFYTDPYQIRSLALNTDYSSGAKFNYPGYQSKKRLVNPEALKIAFENILGKSIEINPETFGGFRLMTESSGAVINVHIDAADWAGLVFLTPNAPLDAGLGIFRHRETGFMSPPLDKEARKIGFEDAQEFERQIVHRDKSKATCWELIKHISPIFNRLVLIRGNLLYHAAIKGFGHNPTNARLTHNFFFNEEIL